MADDYCMSREFTTMLAPRAPRVLRGEDATEFVIERRVGYATALLAHEFASRACASAHEKAGTRTGKPGPMPRK